MLRFAFRTFTMVFISRFLIFGARLFRLSPCSTSDFAAKTGPARKMLCKKIEHIEAVYMSRPPMPAAPPTARSTTHRTIPQARSFERGSANRMRLIGTSARLCAQALCAGPSLHDGAGDKPRAHTTTQTIQETSQEKEEKGKEEKRSIPALRWTLCRLADAGPYYCTARRQLLTQRAHKAHRSAGRTTMPAATPDRANRTHRLIQQCPQLTDSRSPINSIFTYSFRH